jgi:hypothetical protein
MPPASTTQNLKLAQQQIHQLRHKYQFIPRDKLMAFLSRDVVKDILREISAKQRIGYLQPQRFLDPEEMLEHVFTRYRVVLAILIHLNHEEAVESFSWSDHLTDAELPFTAQRLQNVDPDSQLEKSGFLVTQYLFIPAEFKQGSMWEDAEISPFVSEEKIGFGSFSNVFRIQVYPLYDHLAYPQDKFWTDILESGRKVCKRDCPLHAMLAAYIQIGPYQHVYARKKLLKTEGVHVFELERFASKLLNAKNHLGIIPLLAYYYHGTSYNLVFPLADGNLMDYYKSQASLSGPKERLCFIEAIIKLSDALAVIHNWESSKAGLKVYGYHTDMKYSRPS